jgi:hypothetical protein
MVNGKTGPAPRPPEDRFWEKVSRSPDGCWTWEGCGTGGGYGHFGLARNRTLGVHVQVDAHRAAWLFTYGDPGELQVCHVCDNRLCVRPSHLFLGTQSDNLRDMVSKGRHWLQMSPGSSIKGEAQGRSKLTDEKVREIRARTAESASSLAREFGVSRTLIRFVRTGKNWRHVE